jgi:hypothetical protein
MDVTMQILRRSIWRALELAAVEARLGDRAAAPLSAGADHSLTFAASTSEKGTVDEDCAALSASARAGST